MSRPRELHVLRYVPRDSFVHGMWAGTKLLCLGALGMAAAVRPTWISVGILAAVVAAGIVVARIPRGTGPKLPIWFWASIGITGMLAALSGGSPEITVAETVIGFGGLLDWSRFLLLFLLVALGAALLGWTTHLGDIGPAIRTLGAPARVVRVPVDEVAVAVALAVRCLPLLVDEFRTLAAARKVRNPQVPTGLRPRLAQVHDLLVTALVSSMRRARDMAEAMQARGAVTAVPRARVRLRLPDLAALGVASAGSVSMLLL